MFRITHLHAVDEEQWRELFAHYCDFYRFEMPEAGYIQGCSTLIRFSCMPRYDRG